MPKARHRAWMEQLAALSGEKSLSRAPGWLLGSLPPQMLFGPGCHPGTGSALPLFQGNTGNMQQPLAWPFCLVLWCSHFFLLLIYTFFVCFQAYILKGFCCSPAQ